MYAFPETPAELGELRAAIDQHAIIAITDVSGDIIYANDKFCEISQYSRAELLGNNHRLINSGYHPPEFFQQMWRTIAAGHIWRGEIRNRAKDGSLYWVDTTIVPLLNDQGKPRQYVAIRTEITEQKRLEAEMARAARLSLMGEVAASLAHEIKNPLAGIQGAVDILLSRRLPDDPERRVLEGVRGEVARIDALVQQMLRQTRVRAAVLQPESLAEVVKRAVQLGQQTIHLARRESRPQLSLELPEEDLNMPLDAAQLEDAALNLILNAIAAVQEQGADGWVKVFVRRETDEFGDEAVVVVADNGPGLAEADQTLIFKPFYTTKPDGTGLGLSATRRIARAHGGRVEVRSEPGQGAAFYLRLPLS
jgi:two-component system CheB/CheR fusion protein